MRLLFQPRAKCFWFEGSVLLFFAFLLAIYQLPSLLNLHFTGGRVSAYQAIELLAYPAAFAVFNSLLFLFCKEMLIFRGVMIIVSGIGMGTVSFFIKPQIIDPVYFFIICTACAGIIAVYKGEYYAERLLDVSHYDPITDRYLTFVRDGYKYILGKSFQGWLGLGASMGVSMSILFKNGFDDPTLKYQALKMFIAFVGISYAVAYWVGIPLLNGIIIVNERLLELDVELPSERNTGPVASDVAEDPGDQEEDGIVL